MGGLCAPLPTLRPRPRGRVRTARGRCGSLFLHRSGLAPPTPCRSPGALTFVRLTTTFLLEVVLELCLQRSRPRLLTAAAWSGLGPVPEGRSRGAYPHLLHSLCSRSISSWRTPFRVLLQHTLDLPACAATGGEFGHSGGDDRHVGDE